MRRGFGWGAAILVILLLVGVGIGAYNWGLNEGLEQSGNVVIEFSGDNHLTINNATKALLAGNQSDFLL